MATHKNSDSVVLRNDIIEITLGETQSAESVAASVAEVKRISGGNEYDLLVDISNVSFSEGTGLAMAKKLIHELPFKRFAAFGATPKFANLSTKELVAFVDDPEHVKFFRKEEDARAWLGGSAV
jgi:hypothetical protein